MIAFLGWALSVSAGREVRNGSGGKKSGCYRGCDAVVALSLAAGMVKTTVRPGAHINAASRRALLRRETRNGSRHESGRTRRFVLIGVAAA